MASIGFTFLNTTGAPKLSKPAGKQVRGHVTRINFANRRKRRAESATRKPDDARTDAPALKQQQARENSELSTSIHHAWDHLAEALSIATARTDRYYAAQLCMSCKTHRLHPLLTNSV